MEFELETTQRIKDFKWLLKVFKKSKEESSFYVYAKYVNPHHRLLNNFAKKHNLSHDNDLMQVLYNNI